MSAETSPYAIVFGLVLLTVVVVALRPRRRDRVAASAELVARKMGLALVPEVQQAVERRIEQRRRIVGVGGALGSAAAITVIAVFGGGTWSASASMLLVGAIWTVGAFAQALAEAMHAVGPQPGSRVARARAVSIADYLPPRDRMFARVATILGMGAVAIGFAVGTSYPLMVACAVCLTASATMFEVAGRLLVARPQPAASAVELAWDDAFRSIGLRSLAVAPVECGLYSVVAVAYAIDSPVAVLVGIGAVVLALAALIDSDSPGRRRYFMRRLWPDAEGAAA